MPVVDEYIANLAEPQKSVIGHMYEIVRQMAPDATQELSYAMPAFKYKGKGLIAIIANKQFMSVYPYASVKGLGLDLSAFECTTGSIHFTVDKPIGDDLLRQIITARMSQIEN